jgi:hypothetical protein
LSRVIARVKSSIANSDDNDIKRLELTEQIRKSELVVVTGGGVSLYTVGYPKIINTDVASWPGLLVHGLNYCKHHNLLGDDDAEVVELQLKKGTARHLIDAAQQIHDWLDRKQGNSRYFWLKESIGQLKVHDASLIKALASLGGLLATLNYEDLCEEVTGRATLHWRQQLEIDDHVERKSVDFIFHIHGHWQTPNSIVLDQQSYYEIAKDERMQGLMRRFARWGTFLFVGCSGTFSDPSFLTLLRWGNAALNDAKKRHFVLCRKSDEKRLLTDLQRWAMLEPLVYGDSYKDLPIFIEQLAKDSGVAQASANPPLAAVVPSPSGVQKPSDIWKAELQ